MTSLQQITLFLIPYMTFKFVPIILKNINIFLIESNKKKKKTEVNKIDEYIKKQKYYFIKNMNNDDANKNIDNLFYDKEKYAEAMKLENKDIELIWKKRILFENTPYGNIIMYYDTYKQGFAYYSDINGISYDVLNGVAMKYAITYRCRDFYMDENTIEYFISPLVDIYGDFLKTDTNDENKKKIENYRNESVNAKLKKNKIKMVSTNKFICLGKIYNFSFLNERSSTQPQDENKMSYSDYKDLFKNIKRLNANSL
jgi:hypothetical protein